MKTIGNILWHFPFLGFLNALLTFIIGGVFVLTVVGMPLGFGMIELSKFLLYPLEREMVRKKKEDIKPDELWSAFGIFVRIIYFPFGLTIAIFTLAEICGLFISVVGAPHARILLRTMGSIFSPVNKICISRIYSRT